ncbi:hypothetical protein BKA82DRAFT_131634 [Pisolithus tinctorius]|uniref:BTB domain-containing protein n=1 Tax=Pisolithus tinctorius Marx 270 TaxID=870435 RepID=A0A0C3KII1_PISTI|nr:hypothetical protein BKA82DRAFT_131634 [Pisolithus tinctorius]KIO09372.1 hypothetical protein M404DRAFT_131634 [Pisolithus tinctorius Marx 270]
MTTNPSHILIARSSRGNSNPSASLSSPTETHAAAAGIFRSSSSPPWNHQEYEAEDPVTDLNLSDTDKAIEIDQTFTCSGTFPGTVKIIVESTTFWAHKEILYFASPFFQAALSGSWLETGRPPSLSSMITISHHTDRSCCPTPISLSNHNREEAVSDTTSDSSSPVEVECPPTSGSEASGASESELEEAGDYKSRERRVRLAKPRNSGQVSGYDLKGKGKATDTCHPLSARSQSARKAVKNRRKTSEQDAVIVLQEEKANIFHDFLKYVYPHLQCNISWNNVEGLMNISHKFCVPTLQQDCLNFLLTHAAGKPIKAMRIAEIFEEEELYRESSRFVLDNPGGWSEEELSTLSQETLLKLEKRRNWFLERVLKLGLTPLAKEYQCCATCPDPPNCARLLEEKWRQAYNAVFRFGPCQPSMVYRYLRNLEGVSPPLTLTHLACQATAKAFTATLFDRMFSIRSDAAVASLSGGGGRPAAVAATPGSPRRHFLYCTLKPEKAVPRARRSRELL